MGLKGWDGNHTKGVNVTTFGPTPLSNLTKCTYWNCNDLYTTRTEDNHPPCSQVFDIKHTHSQAADLLGTLWSYTENTYQGFDPQIFATLQIKNRSNGHKEMSGWRITSYDEIKVNQLLYGRYPALTCLATFTLKLSAL